MLRCSFNAIFQSKTGYEVKGRHHCRKYNSFCCPKLSQNYVRVSSEFKFWEPRCKTTMQFVLLSYVPFSLSSFPEQFFFLIFILFLIFALGPQIQIWTENLWSFGGLLLGMFWLHLVTIFQWQLLGDLQLKNWSFFSPGGEEEILKHQNWIQEKVGHLLFKNHISSWGKE